LDVAIGRDHDRRGQLSGLGWFSLGTRAA
jgi:hypothetical protein